MSNQICYSQRYCDDTYEYRHVILPREMRNAVSKEHLMTETEWRNLGVQQSTGWVHYMIHQPEPHILLFKRPRTDLKPEQQILEESSKVPRTVAVSN